MFTDGTVPWARNCLPSLVWCIYRYFNC